MIQVRRLQADDWRDWRELRLAALTESPEAFGSKLTDWQGAGDQESRWRNRLNSIPYHVIAELDGVPAGLASCFEHDGMVEIISVWVAPTSRGREVGDHLLAATLAWAADAAAAEESRCPAPRPSRPGLPVTLCVREDNKPAIRLYARHGFIDAGPVPVATGEPPERRMLHRVE